MGIVYSTEHGEMCPRCNRPVNQCACRKRKASSASDGVVRVSRETKGRKGRVVTLVTGLRLQSVPLRQLAKELKQKCGSGGTIRDGVIEIQGEHRDAVIAELTKQGRKAVRSGG